MKFPLVTVIIPLFNKEKYIERAINSVIRQSFKDWELIIIDDGSTDQSFEKAQGFCSPFTNIRMFRQQNKGPGAARNAGLAKARGEFVAFLDADDEWGSNFLEVTTKFFREAGADCATVSTCHYQGLEKKSMVPFWRGRGLVEGIHSLSPRSGIEFAVRLLAFISPWNTLAKTKTLRKYGGFFDQNRCLFGEDAYLWLKVILNEPVGVIMSPHVIHHTEASVLTKNRVGPAPIPPFLLDPYEIQTCCPMVLRKLLDGILEYRAIQTTVHYAKLGNSRVGRDLLSKFRPSGVKTPLRLKALFLTFIATTCPFFRNVKQGIVKLMGCE